jgi:long-chain acyl-CoA synthetase
MGPNEVTAVRAARATAWLARRFEHALADLQLSLPQYRLLTYLSSGNQAASNLAERLTVSRPSITALVDGLVERDYVERRNSDTDRRLVLHQITPVGLAALAEADASLAGAVETVGSRNDDVEGLVEGLCRLADALEAPVKEGAAQ